jgi:hypothetical protein
MKNTPSFSWSNIWLFLLEATKKVKDEETEVIDDIKTADGAYTFTDGCGEISEELANQLYSIIKPTGSLEKPSAYQVPKKKTEKSFSDCTCADSIRSL